MAVAALDEAERGNVLRATELVAEALEKLATKPSDDFDVVLQLEDDRVHLRRMRADLAARRPMTVPDSWRRSARNQERRQRSATANPERQERRQERKRSTAGRSQSQRGGERPATARAPRSEGPRTSGWSPLADAIDQAQRLLEVGSYRQAQAQVDKARALLPPEAPRGVLRDVQADPLLRRLELVERQLAPMLPPPPDAPAPPRKASTSIHTVGGGLPTLGRRR